MAKVVYTSLGALKRRKRGEASSKPETVPSKRVKNAAGKTTVIYTVDANSATFGRDLGIAFAKNVKKVRRENRQVIGTADIVPKRS